MNSIKQLRKTWGSYKLKKVLFWCLIEVGIILFSLLAFSLQCVEGIAGNSNGQFAIALNKSNVDEEHVLLFYDQSGNLVNNIIIYIRGGMYISDYNDKLYVQHTSGLCDIYNYKGNLLVERVEPLGDMKPKLEYNYNNIRVYYLQHGNGIEDVYIEKDGEIRTLDINYSYYIKLKWRNMILTIALGNWFLIVFHFIRKKKKQST